MYYLSPPQLFPEKMGGGVLTSKDSTHLGTRAHWMSTSLLIIICYPPTHFPKCFSYLPLAQRIRAVNFWRPNEHYSTIWKLWVGWASCPEMALAHTLTFQRWLDFTFRNAEPVKMLWISGWDPNAQLLYVARCLRLLGGAVVLMPLLARGLYLVSWLKWCAYERVMSSCYLEQRYDGYV